MGDRASITVRYDIKIWDNLYHDYDIQKGIFTNVYRGFNPIGLVSRVCTGVQYIINNADILKYGDMKETIRRVFDVDYVFFGYAISQDNTGCYDYEADKKKIELSEEELEEQRDDRLEDMMFCDPDFGQVIIDIYGEYNEAFTNNGLIIKYAILPYYRETDEIQSIDEYMEEYKFDEDTIDRLSEVLGLFERATSLMTKAEMDKFNHMDVDDYLGYNIRIYIEEEERKKKEEEEQKRAYRDMFQKPSCGKADKECMKTMPIEVLELSARTYNCLKRAGYNTIGELLALSDEDWRHIRNLGRKGIEEAKAKLGMG